MTPNASTNHEGALEILPGKNISYEVMIIIIKITTGIQFLLGELGVFSEEDTFFYLSQANKGNRISITRQNFLLSHFFRQSRGDEKPKFRI